MILALCAGIISYAQNKFQKGYFIESNGVKTECLIQNDDWNSNPTSFRYKKSEDSSVLIGNLSNVIEFAVGNSQKYQRFNVGIDRSSRRLSEISRKRTPDLTMETLFLKVLIEGQRANLYSYTDSDLRRYFYNKPSTKITQLVYKTYRSEKGRILNNELYKKQLEENLSCASISFNPSYTKSSLVKYFIAYNNCDSETNIVKNFTLSETKSKIRLKLKVGVNAFKVDATELGIPFGDPNYESDVEISPRFGFEFEYLLPNNNNRWALFAEPSYQSFQGQAELNIPGSVVITRTAPVDYKSIEVPIGLRHYIPLGGNNDSRIFFNAAFIFDFPMNSTVRSRELDSGNNVYIGGGYEFDKFSLEARYSFGRSLTKFQGLDTSYSGFNVTFGYVIF